MLISLELHGFQWAEFHNVVTDKTQMQEQQKSLPRCQDRTWTDSVSGGVPGEHRYEN